MVLLFLKKDILILGGQYSRKKYSNDFLCILLLLTPSFFINQDVQSIGHTFGNDYLMNIVGEKLRYSRITKIEPYINSYEKFRPNRN